MGRRKTVSVGADRQYTADLQAMTAIEADLLSKKRLKGHKLWWYVVRRDQWPIWYWDQGGRHWVGSFRGLASRYRTKEKAEKALFMVAVSESHLIGHLDVIERD